MNIYLLEQDQRAGYDTYDSVVVFAPSEDAARLMHPCTYSHYVWTGTKWGDEKDRPYGSWTWGDPDRVKVTYLGEGPSTETGVICASFNAG